MAKRRDTRSFSDTQTSSFPKMGDSSITDGLVNVSGNRSPYTTAVPRKGPAGDSFPGEGTKANRSANQIHEAHGPTFRPVATTCFPNAPEAAQVQRGLRTVPSSVGNRDFWDRRSGDGGQVIA